MNKAKTSKHDAEAAAIDGIMRNLQDVPEERKTAVLEYIYERVSGKVLAADPAKPSTQGQVNPGQAGTDIKTFLKNKDCQNAYQQVAVLAFYLKQHRGVDGVNKKIIEDANQEALGRTIDNTTVVLNDATSKYKFFGRRGAEGKKFLLAHGEDIVNALPDHQKVSELMKNSGKKRKKKRQGAK